MKLFLDIVQILAAMVVGFVVGNLITDHPGPTEKEQVTCNCTDSTIAPAIDRLTDAILAGTDTMAKESNESQAILDSIRRKHYSPY